MLELVRGFGLSAIRVQVEHEFLNELKDPQRAKTSCIMTRLLRERRVKTPGRFGRLTCLMRGRVSHRVEGSSTREALMIHDTPPTRAQGENPWPIWEIDVFDDDFGCRLGRSVPFSVVWNPQFGYR